MKKLFSLLNLILCFELLVGPMMSTGGILTIQSAMAEDCPAGTSFDSTLNRCLTSEQTAQVMNAVANCNGSQACYKQTAEDALKKAEEEGKIQEQLANKAGLLNTSMKAAAVAIPLTIAAGALFKTGKKCLSMSKIAMVAGGAALFAGDMIANMLHKNRMKKIEEEWNGILKTDTSSGNGTTTVTDKPKATEAQSQAFEMLAKSEDSMASAAKMKAGFFGAGTVAFAASAVMATMEILELKKKTDLVASTIGEPAAHTAAKTALLEASNRINCLNETAPASPDAPAVEPPVSPAPSGGRFNIEAQIKNLDQIRRISYLNLNRSPSLAAFYTLKNFDHAFLTRSSPTLDEYEANVALLKDSGIENDTQLLNLIKKISGQILAGVNPLPSAHAQAAPAAPAAAVADGAANPGLIRGGMNIVRGLPQALQRPMPRAIIAGVFAAWGATMTMHAMKQASVSTKRAEFLRKIKTDFNDATSAIGSCSDAQRASPDSPNCYCYTAEGGRNSARANSAVCVALFTGKNVSDAETSYLAGSSNVGTCFATNGSIDASCACRATNSCLQATSGASMTGLATGGFSMLAGPLSTVDNLGNGTANAANISGSASVSNAMKLLDASAKLASTTPEGKNMLKQKSKIANDFARSAASAGAGISPSFLGNSSGNPSAMSPSDAVAELQKEFKEASAPINTANGGGAVAAPTPGTAEQFDFGMTTEQRTQQDTQIAEAMKQDLDYGQNDIKGSDTNLFDAVSNRYQQSGMRRLFEDKKKIPEDKK